MCPTTGLSLPLERLNQSPEPKFMVDTEGVTVLFFFKDQKTRKQCPDLLKGLESQNEF